MITFGLILLLALLALSVSVTAALGVLSFSLAIFFTPIPLDRMLGDVAWQSMASESLVAIPFFVLLGEVMVRSGLAERMYAALVEWLSWLPGGTMHANIGACALFAATSGSSVATAATIGTVSIPEIKRRGYGERLFLGSLAAGGTLGILIPPSIILIIYGVLTDTSIPRLYLAGTIPGLALAVMFMLTIVVACWLRPSMSGIPPVTNWSRRIAVLPDLLPPLFIFGLVVLTIYAGIATPTEAAAFGVVGALGLAFQAGSLNLKMLQAVVEGTMRTTAMVVAIVLTSTILNFVLTFLGISKNITAFIHGLDIGPVTLMLILVAFYLVLGCFLEGMSIMLITVPIIVPVVVAAGYDTIWFGVVMTLLLEAALITPPVGVNLFVVQSVRGRGSLADVMIGAAPFVLTIMLMIGLLLVFPGIALWLPTWAYQ
ncbi:TRAP transporter large permease subunit [Pseudaminobacter arsenicus]|uniref:TRAP transporter large permease protein n=1 Tax=Borborobacter arsenicus TaxID=1851146 RepID=A0A432V338_9HYPH|nr:TRAP transporter large permease subunit [Pseudaminobacter arsenicus]RUM96623.1 TRAP transporter large permease subunit [Pseudaminobacter arsenicus]